MYIKVPFFKSTGSAIIVEKNLRSGVFVRKKIVVTVLAVFFF